MADHLKDGDLLSITVERMLKGTHAKQLRSPKWPASTKPTAFGHIIYKIPVARAANLLKPNPFLVKKYIPSPPTTPCKKIDMIKAKSIGKSRKSIFGI